MQQISEDFLSSVRLTTWVRYLLYAQIVIAAISLVGDYMEYQLLSDLQDGIYLSSEEARADATVSDQRQQVIGICYLIVFVISAILILRWIYKSNINARNLGAKNMTFSPGWSVGYYFIPILTLWKPYQAMKEIWKASKAPSDWEHQNEGGFLSIWWTLWLFSNAIGQFIFRRSLKAEEISELLNLNIANQVSDVVDVLLALVFLKIVNEVSGFQTAHLPHASDQTSAATARTLEKPFSIIKARRRDTLEKILKTWLKAHGSLRSTGDPLCCCQFTW